MQPRKLNVMFAFFPYGGNGGISSEHPNIRNWMVKTVLAAKQDPRIGEIFHKDFSDTPITMTRNASVEHAKKCGADVLFAVDSDNHPDVLLGQDPSAKPFFDTAFDFIYANYDKGPHVVGAPYCGPPPFENVYVFQWANWNTHRPDHEMRLEPFTREEASHRTGIEAVAALPTGCIMYDMRAFEYIEPPYFFYEYEGDGIPCEACGQRKPGTQAKKASTEDVTNTREISMHIALALGYNPVHVAWDCWAGHYKPLCVGKPQLTSISQVSKKYADAVLRKQRLGEKTMMIGEPMDEMDAPSQSIVQELGNPANLAQILDRQYRKILGADFMDDINRQIQERMTKVVPVEDLRKFNARPTGLELSTRADGVELVGMVTMPDQLNALTEIVRNLAATKQGYLRCIEIGSWVGESAIAIHRGLSFGGGVYCVDTWKGSATDQTRDFVNMAKDDLVYKTFLKNTKGLNITACRNESVEYAEVHNGRGIKYDFIYIDADHSYGACKADIQAWLPLLAEGGIIAGHDYHCAGFPGVTQAVDEMFAGIQVMQDTNIWWVRQEDIAWHQTGEKVLSEIAATNGHPQRTPEQEAVRNRVLDRTMITELHKSIANESDNYEDYTKEARVETGSVLNAEWFEQYRREQKRQLVELSKDAPEPHHVVDDQIWHGNLSDDDFRKAIAAAPEGSSVIRVLTPGY